MPHPDFNPPGKPPKLTSRRSTLTGLFVMTLTPYIEPTEAEVDEALGILGMKRGACVCAYCGDKKSEWDHFRAVVLNRRPTGYVTEIANLVPACGKCNQSRGNKEWKEWMLGAAVHSPARRGVQDIDARVGRLSDFSEWRKPVRIDFDTLIAPEKWTRHTENLANLLRSLEEAEVHAAELRLSAEVEARRQRGIA